MGTNNKLREALESIVAICDSIEPMTYAEERLIVYNTAKAALAAPQKNCERFATVDEARKAHEAICEKYVKCHHGCPLNNEEHYSSYDCFEAWLFAPATEKEGGASR